MVPGFPVLGFALVVLAGASQDASLASSAFLAGDVRTKGRALIQLFAPEANVSIAQVVTLVGLGMRDPSRLVRLQALSAISARVTMARWAGTSGPQLGPGPGPRRELPVIPIEWKDDQQKLRDALYDQCLEVLKGDQDPEVRRYALNAVGNLNLPASPGQPYGDEFVALLVNLFRSDRDPRIRAAAVGSLHLMPNDSTDVRGVIRDGLVDAQEAVRSAALTAIEPVARGGRSKVSFREAQPVLDRGLEAKDAGVRLGAVRALNVFGASSVAYIPLLERMRETDPDYQVRTSAQLAIESIQRALKGRVP